MAKITYIEHDGTQHTANVNSGTSLMEGAVKNNIPGIDADCGGACACATCHVYIDDPRIDKAASLSAIEESMLQLIPNVKPTSRLSCQIPVREDLEGLIVHMPESQQ